MDQSNPHSYIGTLEQVRSNVDIILGYEQNESTNNLAIIPFHDLVLFPNESIPLRLHKSFFRSIPGWIESINQQGENISHGNQYYFPFHIGIVYHTVEKGSIGK